MRGLQPRNPGLVLIQLLPDFVVLVLIVRLLGEVANADNALRLQLVEALDNAPPNKSYDANEEAEQNVCQ